ncbi:IS630 family transposase [Baaleninema simplex]|uniref:IS630 family transposase n=1 Tax=Baaleninema simplex TaxID=2862350 RepID=UPI00034BCC14|nr:IS630 family transposase [Baaleninema simplex]
MGISYGYAREVVKNYNEQGEKSIRNQRNKNRSYAGGRTPLLKEEQLQKLQEALKEKPEDGGQWTGPKVARWIEKEAGREKVWKQRGWDYLKKCGYSWQRPRPKHKKGNKEEQEEFKKNLPIKVRKLQEKHPNTEVQLWFFDEHRVGLKPILAKVWALTGQRPDAIVEHRYEWVYVYGFVNPKTGETHWYLIPRVNVQWLNLVFQTFAKDVGAAAEKIILLVEDRAGWHTSPKVEVPSGMEIEYLPPYSPELQPAERLWKLVDEPLVNTYFETIEELEEVLGKRCCVLQEQMQEEIRDLTNYHWLEFAA